MAGKPSYAELEKRVRELEERCSLLPSVNLDSFFVEAPAGIALFDRECRFVRINKTLADFAGHSVAEHLGRRPREVLPATAAAEIEEGLQRVLATGEAACNREISAELPAAQGNRRHWLHSQFPVHDAAGNIVGAGAIVTEITEVKRLLAEVSHKELFLRLLFKNLPQKIFVKDAGSRYLYCNENFARDLGIIPDEIVGLRDEDFFPADIAERFRADDQRVMASGKTEDTEEVHILEGLEWAVHTVKAPVVSEEGAPVGLIGIFHDITVRRRAEKALAQYQAGLEQLVARRTAELQAANAMLQLEIDRCRNLQEELSRKEKRYREVVEGTEDLITQVDAQGRLLFVNHAAQRIFGLKPEACLGLSAFDFIHPQDRAETRQAFRGWLRERRSVAAWGNRQLGRNGEMHFLHWTCNFHYDANGALLHVNGIARDMTELQKTQEALRQACAGQEKRIAAQTRELERKVAELVEVIEKHRQTEADLRESEERFRQIAENINSVFWIRDLSAEKILYVSPAYEKIWGRSCESLYLNPDSWAEALHPGDRDRVLAGHLSRKARERGFEYRIIREDQDIRWIRAKIFRVCGRTGRKYREVGVAEDITTYMEILDRLRESKSRYRTFFETSSDGISVYELRQAEQEKKLVDCNASYAKLAGRDRAELFGLADIRSLKTFFDRRTGAERRSPSLNLVRKDGRCAGFYSWVRQDGQANFVECRGNRIAINGQELMHCVHRDMTQVKRAEEKIRHLSRRIIESTEAEQKRIARDLHDEFGQRLLAMRHKVDTLQKKIVSAGKPDLSEVAEIARLIDTLGAVVRGVTNKLRPDLLDTLGFLPTLKWGMRDFAERHPLLRTSLEIVGAEKKILPEYEIALCRVFQEGLTNIAKHARASTVTARLIFSYPSLILTLADDGLGFAQDPLSGFPLNPHGGLGLRSMQERMLAIGGTLALRSRPGEGMVLRAEVRQPTPQPEALPCFMMSGYMRS